MLPISTHFKITPFSSILALGAVMAFACVLAKDNVEFPEITLKLSSSGSFYCQLHVL